MTVSLNVFPATVNPGDKVFIELTLTGEISTNYLFSIFPDIDVFEEPAIGREFGTFRAGRNVEMATTYFTVSADATPQTITFTIDGLNSNADGVVRRLITNGDRRTVAIEAAPVRVPKTGSVVQPTTSPSVIHPGDVVRVRVQLLNADPGNYRFYFTQNTPHHLDFGDDKLYFGFEEGETERTVILQSDAAVLTSNVNGQLNLHPDSDDARDILAGTESFTVQIQPTPIPPLPSADSVNIVFSPSASVLMAGDYVYITMSLPGASDDAFVFSFYDTGNRFEAAAPFTIQGSEVVNTFLRVRADAATGAGQLLVLGDNTAALAIESLITQFYDYTVIPTPIVPEIIPPSIESATVEFSPVIVRPGGKLFLKMTLTDPSADEFRYYVRSDIDGFGFREREIVFAVGTTSADIFYEVLRAATPATGTLTIAPANEAARGTSAVLADFVPFIFEIAPVAVPVAPVVAPGNITRAVRGGVNTAFAVLAELKQDFTLTAIPSAGPDLEYDAESNTYRSKISPDADITEEFNFSGLAMGVAKEKIDSGQAQRGDLDLLVENQTLEGFSLKATDEIVRSDGKAFTIVDTSLDPTNTLLSVHIRERG